MYSYFCVYRNDHKAHYRILSHIILYVRMFNFKLRVFNVCDYGVSSILIGHTTVLIFVFCLEASNNYISRLLIVPCIVRQAEYRPRKTYYCLLVCGSRKVANLWCRLKGWMTAIGSEMLFPERRETGRKNETRLHYKCRMFFCCALLGARH